MTSAEVLKYSRKIGPRIQKALGLQKFRVKYIAGEIAEDENLVVPAMIKILPHYEKAHIFLAVDHIDSEQELFRLLRHEMLHLLLSSFEEAELALGELVPKSQYGCMTKLMEHASERAVLALERTALATPVNGLESTTKKPISR